MGSVGVLTGIFAALGERFDVLTAGVVVGPLAPDNRSAAAEVVPVGACATVIARCRGGQGLAVATPHKVALFGINHLGNGQEKEHREEHKLEIHLDEIR